jgi:di/tricarboxylate transporter
MSDLMSGTYKTLPEQKEVLSPAEERFERARHTVGLVFGPIAFLIVYFAPLALEPGQQTLAAILAFTIVYWLSEAIPIPVTALLALANLIGIGFIEQATGARITFFDWVLMAAPIVLVMFVALCIILLLLNKPEVRSISGATEYIAEQRGELSPLSRGERNTLVVFGVAVTLWILPGLLALFLGDESAVYTTTLNRLDEGTVAILAATLLFLLPVNWAERRFTLNWNDAAGIEPMIPALAAVFGASFGFMMPVSTPQNAVVYGSGVIPITKMVRSGVVFDIIGLAITVALIPIMARLVGLV